MDKVTGNIGNTGSNGNNQDEDTSDSDVDYDDKDAHNFKLIYSPRTRFSKKLEREEELFNDLTLNFDPITIKIIKKHFKERLGSLNNIEFISILKNHLLSWHPKHPQRERILIKLLRRLFSEIDLNDNGSMEWAEFTNYIIHNSNSVSNKGDNSSFKLRFYSLAKNTIDTKDLADNVGYAFYIEKTSLVGIVENDKSVIHFYDANSFRRLKCHIDLKDIQKDIDYLELKELDERAEKKKQQEKEERIKLRQIRLRNQRKFMPKTEENEEIGENNMSEEGDSGLSSEGMDEVNGNIQKTNSKIMSKLETKSQLNTNVSKLKSKNKASIASKISVTKIGGKESAGNNRNSSVNPNPSNNNNNNNSSSTKTTLNKTTENKTKRNTLVTNNINKKLTVLCTLYLQEYDVLLVSASNNRISAWKYSNGEFRNVNTTTESLNIEKNYFMCAILMTNSPQYTMAWDSLQKYLYTGQIDGKINKWDLTKSNPIGVLDMIKATSGKEGTKRMNTYSTESSASPRGKFEKNDPNLEKKIKKSKYIKRDSVSYILLINKIQLLAASYFNGMIILWDTLLMEKRKAYEDHKTGVYHMTYDSTKNLLFSCGFSRDIYVYDPYIDFPVYKLSGHYGSIYNLICNEKDSELISLDVHGNMKIWDTQLLLNFQTINLDESSSDNGKTSSHLKMIYLKKQKKIMLYGSKIQIYETDKSLNPDLADDQIIFACFYDKVAKSVISFCLRKIKMWNPFTGKIKKVYEDPMQNEITAFTIDRNMKRTFLGDNMGKIKNFNMKNGKYLKDLTPHDLEINMLAHSLALNIVVSCSVDNVIKIHDDQELMDTVMIKELKIQGFQVKSIAIIDHLQRLAIGLSSGTVKFYDIEHFRYDSDLNSDVKSTGEEVTCLFPFNELEVIFSAHSSGACRFMVTPPSGLKFIIFHQFFNKSDKDAKNNIPVTCIDFDYENNRMFCGDQLGYISCYDLTEMFDLIESTKLSKDKNPLDLKISNEFINKVGEISVPKLWTVEGHQESIKHLHYTDIEPNIIISTSHDLRVRIFLAEDGEYIDELKQISNKFHPVPIGIKYRGIDPINKTPYKETVWRKDLAKITFQNIDEIEENNTAEYSNKITLFNAKEKLLQHVKNANVGENQSNKWNLMIDLEAVKMEEENEMAEIYMLVKQKEFTILKTEMIMQQKSIYNESYKPLFINEMNDEKVKDFSKTLSQKLRHVKLAISKANLGQNKYASIGEEQAKKGVSGKSTTVRLLGKPSQRKLGEESPRKSKSKSRENSINKNKKKKLNPLKGFQRKGSVIAAYIRPTKKDMSPNEIFENCKYELEKQINDLQKPFMILAKKGKIKQLAESKEDNSVNLTEEDMKNIYLNKI